jgi:hypothetical protein
MAPRWGHPRAACGRRRPGVAPSAWVASLAASGMRRHPPLAAAGRPHCSPAGALLVLVVLRVLRVQTPHPPCRPASCWVRRQNPQQLGSVRRCGPRCRWLQPECPSVRLPQLLLHLIFRCGSASSSVVTAAAAAVGAAAVAVGAGVVQWGRSHQTNLRACTAPHAGALPRPRGCCSWPRHHRSLPGPTGRPWPCLLAGKRRHRHHSAGRPHSCCSPPSASAGTRGGTGSARPVCAGGRPGWVTGWQGEWEGDRESGSMQEWRFS